MAMPGRAYDALYDGTYTVSGARDHYRQQTVAGGFNVARAPNYPYMFSELPHFPATSYRFKNSDKVPGFVDRGFHETVSTHAELSSKSQADQVNGRHNYKYYRRPMLAAPESGIIIKQAPQVPLPPPPPIIEEPKSKTTGTQSDYRENEAQTLPWDPDFVLPVNPTDKQKSLAANHHCDGPELLKLRDLKFGDGLPPGLQEIRRIQKMREKRAFEATLPPIDDLERLPLRQKMIEEWESKEWEDREREIQSVQDERLALLEEALLAREDEFDEGTMRRVEGRKTMLLQDGSGRFAAIQASRIKTMRRLIEARKYVEKPRKLHKLTIVEKYANFGSSLYAPVQRDGRFSETKSIETEGFQPVTLQGLHELESYIPHRSLEPKIAVPVKPLKLDYKQRKDAAVQRDLKAINDLLDTAKFSKGGRGIGDCWPAPLKDASLDAGRGSHKRTSIRPAERPDTPVLAAAATPAASREAAAVLLQRLLRGRAAQNAMYEGKTRRQALIEELRIDVLGNGSSSRPEDITDEVTAELDTLVGHVLSGICSALAEQDPEARAEQMANIISSAPILTRTPTPTPPPTAPAMMAPAVNLREAAASAAERRGAEAAEARREAEAAATQDASQQEDFLDVAAEHLPDAQVSSSRIPTADEQASEEGEPVHMHDSSPADGAAAVSAALGEPQEAVEKLGSESSAQPEEASVEADKASAEAGEAQEPEHADEAAAEPAAVGEPQEAAETPDNEPSAQPEDASAEADKTQESEPAGAKVESENAEPLAAEGSQTVFTPAPPDGQPPSGGRRPGSGTNPAPKGTDPAEQTSTDTEEDPTAGTGEPATATEEPDTAPEEPATAGEEPAAAEEKPATADKELATADEEPVTAAADEKPATAADGEPATAADEVPATANVDPAAAPEEPSEEPAAEEADAEAPAEAQQPGAPEQDVAEVTATVEEAASLEEPDAEERAAATEEPAPADEEPRQADDEADPEESAAEPTAAEEPNTVEEPAASDEPGAEERAAPDEEPAADAAEEEPPADEEPAVAEASLAPNMEDLQLEASLFGGLNPSEGADPGSEALSPDAVAEDADVESEAAAEETAAAAAAAEIDEPAEESKAELTSEVEAEE